MTGFEVTTVTPVTLSRSGRLIDMYVLSPFVWTSQAGYEMLLRAVPRRDDEPRLKIAEIWYGRSSDGVHFVMDPGPVIFPGPGLEDLDGCEDPTVVVGRNELHLWYTGWNQAQSTGRLMYASGLDARRIAKHGRALDSQPDFANPKEATVVPGADASWRLFFEYARHDASCMGIASASDPRGPWSITGPVLAPRDDRWDDWHLSPGPIIDAETEHPLMFYNGATRDARWRIGWAQFNRDFSSVVARGDEPLITPEALANGATDIAFAASALDEGGHVQLYYSLSDKDLRRATLRRL